MTSLPLKMALRTLTALCIALLLPACASKSKIETNTPPQGYFVDIEGYKMHYIDQGLRNSSLRPIVLIHGANANLLDMKMALGDRFSKTRRVIMIDRPGHGYSERPKDGYALSTQTRLINGVIKSLGVEKPIILGQSFGGAVALNYALEYPGQLSALMLIAPVSHEWDGGVDAYHGFAINPIIGPAFRGLATSLYKGKRGRDAALSSFAPQEPPADYYEKAGVSLLFRNGNFKANSEDLHELHDQLAMQQNRYNQITVPVRIISGTKDTSVWPSVHSQGLKRDIKGAKLTMLEGIGHPLHHAKPDVIERQISELDTDLKSLLN